MFGGVGVSPRLARDKAMLKWGLNTQHCWYPVRPTRREFVILNEVKNLIQLVIRSFAAAQDDKRCHSG
jgi:hypothetical protein